MGGDQVHRVVVLEHVDVGALAHTRCQGALHLFAGGVRGVDDAAVGVSSLACQVIAPRLLRLVVTGEADPLVEQPMDGVRAVLDDHLDHLAVAQ